MKRNELETLQDASQQIESPFDPKALILMYHRLADARSDPWALPGMF